jgi:SAM-dependent methyltransferase
VNTVRYHRVLLDAVPRPCRRALDVGCGLGAFARHLAPLAECVDAIDRDVDVIGRARAAAAAVPNITFTCADAMTAPIEAGYDFICALASLHHLPLDTALVRLARLLRPGGVLGVIGLYRPATVFDHVAFVTAYPFGLWQRGRNRNREPDRVPLRAPTASLDEIRAAAAVHLPGAAIHRRLMWRYTMLYRSPA